jgi:hypothetical protein
MDGTLARPSFRRFVDWTSRFRRAVTSLASYRMMETLPMKQRLTFRYPVDRGQVAEPPGEVFSFNQFDRVTAA